MAKILLTWELGSGFGHVASLSSIARGLRQRGHQVVAASRDPVGAQSFFAPMGVSSIAAPRPTISPRIDPTTIATYSDLLRCVGFHSVDALRPVLSGWDQIYDEVQPDAVVFDHSPFRTFSGYGSAIWQTST